MVLCYNPQNLEPFPWRIRPLKPCGVITKVLSILLQERFLENVRVPRNHGYPRLLLLLLISAGKLSAFDEVVTETKMHSVFETRSISVFQFRLNLSN